MNRVTIAATNPLLSKKPWAISCGLAIALGASAFAQSATNFNTQKVAPKAPSPKALAGKNPTTSNSGAQEAGPVAVGPSRYVSEPDLAAYVETLSSVFSMRNREIDPFGQLQDPDAKPIVKPTIAKRTRRAAPTQITPFAEIIRRIQVTTIMPGEHRFLIGTRSFKQGDRFPVNFRGRSLDVEISSVTSRQIDFVSLESGETASLKLTLLPVGMTPGNGKITAPGMVREQANSPLEIEPGNSSNENSQN